MLQQRYVIGIISLIIIFVCAFSLSFYNSQSEPQSVKPNYLGLVQLGVLPNHIQCTMPMETYFDTQVRVSSSDGDTYAILQNKLGDNSCVVKL